jgi:hypothetical protein
MCYEPVVLVYDDADIPGSHGRISLQQERHIEECVILARPQDSRMDGYCEYILILLLLSIPYLLDVLYILRSCAMCILVAIP